jgi:hypothetical protein
MRESTKAEAEGGGKALTLSRTHGGEDSFGLRLPAGALGSRLGYVTAVTAWQLHSQVHKQCRDAETERDRISVSLLTFAAFGRSAGRLVGVRSCWLPRCRPWLSRTPCIMHHAPWRCKHRASSIGRRPWTLDLGTCRRLRRISLTDRKPRMV